MSKAAREKLQLKEPPLKGKSCHPELQPIIDARLQATKNCDYEGVKSITKVLKKARQIRTNEQINTFKNNERDPVKQAKSGYKPEHTKMTNIRGELVPDSLRAQALAEYFEQVQWELNDAEEYKHIGIDKEPIFEECAEMNTESITLKELNHAIHRLKNKKAPGQDGIPSELYKRLNEDNRKTLLKRLNECWESETLEDTMHDASLATICKKGRSDKPENYRPIALLNVTYKILAIIIHVQLYETIDGRISKTQFGFRKNKSTAQPRFIYRRIQELQEEAGLSFHTLLLDWEKAFDKVEQKRMIKAFKRLGIKYKLIRMIAAIYKEPKFTIKDGKTQIIVEDKRQESGKDTHFHPTCLSCY